MGETPQKKMKILTSEETRGGTSLSEKIRGLYNKSRVYWASLVSLYRTVFPQTLCAQKEKNLPHPKKRLLMLMTRPGHGYAIACSSFLGRSIAH
jgi:hypothetical protein